MPRDVRREHLLDALGATCLWVVAIAVYARLYVAISFTDEAFYIALPYSFWLGHQPVGDEIATHQFAGLLLQPAISAYAALMGSSSGIVLFSRHLYFAVALACTLLVRRYFTRAFGGRVANFVAAVSLAYIPFLIPSISYNSLAGFGLLVGAVFFASACLPDRDPARLCLGVATLAAATFAYPPLIVAAGATVVLGLIGLRATRGSALLRRASVYVALTGIGCAVLASLVLLALGDIEDFARILEFNSAMAAQGGGAEKLTYLGYEFAKESRFFVALVVVLGCIALGYSRLSRVAAAALLCAALAPALHWIGRLYKPITEPYSTIPFVLSAIGLAAPMVLFAVRSQLTRDRWIGLAILVAASFIATPVILWSTANGLRNGTLGMLPATLVTLACLSRLQTARADAPPPPPPQTITHECDEAENATRPHAGLPFALLLTSLIAFQLVQTWTHNYGDFPIWQLRVAVTDGPWKGIRTSPGRLGFIRKLTADLAQARGAAQTVIFFPFFPAGYLLTDLRPLTPAIWIFPDSDTWWGNRAARAIYADELRKREEQPGLVVQMHCVPLTSRRAKFPSEPDDPLTQRLTGPDYRVTHTHPCYTISSRQQNHRPEHAQ